MAEGVAAIRRYRCPECGRQIPAEQGGPEVGPQATDGTPRKSILLRGRYCSSSHLLDAWTRGYPRWKLWR